MNHYDYAHNLARALKESGEYQGLLKARKQLASDPKNKEMLLEFRRLQWEAEKARVLQQDVDEITERRMNQLGDLIGANTTIQEYLMAEYRFGQIMADIQKILSDALSDWFRAAAEFVVDEEEES
ncbi:MAG TPA: YlbF family regulator [Syntrophaceticus sp.]|jgi:cell fate (sporulation/competence/biofilm development) regulator YlbF (YheA/YmcA/DUF963 family)|uniref:Uncharacterized protein n=1 Tax=Syntrophaceticus schinkii TaxID=499207 RepID=A0A0B7MRW8_9FIRM|nr:YlbF family regulator [Syntrophaceticus schinkii]HHY29262.1 YlbF family regulator [Syntrophaceticus sp.]MDD2360462.1 YlbF family regulator [Syntrophaceticus schinkii]MDD4262096.1 YlbF family regulator [Syntrophaceticus schinkii]MDD4675413.1 YlbF family regulator [Syntrophaceticus schinkii]CEO90412.1 conserved hypothetical protein [Syntrophaceticus schinkii]